MRYFLVIIIFVFAGLTQATEITSLEQARELARTEGKNVLMEFGREDCEYCQKANDEFQKNSLIKESLDKIIHIKLNVALSDHYEIAQQYKVGYTYPVYIMTNSDGNVFGRWTGFIDASQFLREFNKSLSVNITLDDRKSRLKSNPNYNDAIYLAEYFNATKDYLEAIKYYQESMRQNNNSNYSYDIFVNSAEACWNSLIPFNDVRIAADDVLKTGDTKQIINTARVITNCARRAGTTDKISKYILKAIEIVSNSTDYLHKKQKYELLAEKALYIENDMNKALRIIKISLGNGWKTDPERYFKFAEWCQKRNINLKQAEEYARSASERASSGKLKAKVLNTLAEICFQQDKINDAIRFIERAIDENPSREFYPQQLQKFRFRHRGNTLCLSNEI